jgi:DNA repair ATPase RecN
MTEKSDRIAEIKSKLSSHMYKIENIKSAEDDIQFLLDQINEKDEFLKRAQKKTDVLSQQVLELTQEIENAKSDFGGQR